MFEWAVEIGKADIEREGEIKSVIIPVEVVNELGHRDEIVNIGGYIFEGSAREHAIAHGEPVQSWIAMGDVGIRDESGSIEMVGRGVVFGPCSGPREIIDWVRERVLEM